MEATKVLGREAVSSGEPCPGPSPAAQARQTTSSKKPTRTGFLKDDSYSDRVKDSLHPKSTMKTPQVYYEDRPQVRSPPSSKVPPTEVWTCSNGKRGWKEPFGFADERHLPDPRPTAPAERDSPAERVQSCWASHPSQATEDSMTREPSSLRRKAH